MQVTEQERRLLESYLDLSNTSGGPDLVPKRASGDTAPLTFAQQQIWLHAQLAPDTPLYNEPFTIHRTGPLDISLLQQSLTEIVRRHEAWRTTFPVVSGEPIQRIHEPFEVQMQVSDLRHLSSEERKEGAIRLATEDARIPFDLTACPLFRVRLIQLTDEEFRIAITAHHLIFDGVTGYWVFLPELVEIYRALVCAAPVSLPMLDFQYGDFATWQYSSATKERLEAGLTFWQEQLKGKLPILQLPTDRPRPAMQSFRGALEPFTLPARLSEDIRELARKEGVTLFMVLLAAFDTLLYRYSGQEDILVGSVTAGRKLQGTEKLMGFFLNTVALRTDISGDPTFRQLVARVRQVTINAMAHDDVPLGELVKRMQPGRDLSRNPLFQVLLSFEPSMAPVEPGWNLTAIDVETGTAKFDLCVVLDDRPEGLQGRIIYSTDLFDACTIVRMIGHWTTLLESATRNPGAPIAQLPMMPQEELKKVLLLARGRQETYTDETVTSLISAAAATHPGATAVKCGEHVLTYSELERRANQLAVHLLKHGITRETKVAVCCERSLELIVGILGTLKAGGAYVPLDPTHPKVRLETLLSDCQAEFLLTQAHLPPLEWDAPKSKTWFLDTDWPQISREPVNPPNVTVDPADLAYILYTSGSTGKPKGVMIEHASLSASTRARIEFYKEPVGNYLLLSPIGFDSSVAVIFHTLCTGGTLVIPDAEVSWEADDLADIVDRERIRTLLCVPSVYNDLLTSKSGAQRLRWLRTVVVAGETCPRKLVGMHYELLSDASLFNEYGPTEATVWSTVHLCDASSDSSSVSIGTPIANTSCYVLDEAGCLSPLGVPGELCIAGAGLARGYWHDEHLTEQKFVWATVDGDRRERLYKTGDLVRWLPDGNLEFRGRVDQQIKLRGLRIEIAEIEVSISEHPDVHEAAVALRRSDSGDSELTAYVLARGEFSTSDAELKAFLRNRLPGYMIPAQFIFVSSLPRNANGKLDRNALSRSGGMLRDVEVESPKPRDFVDARVLTIWKEVLGRDDIDIRKGFFELGGHSLLAAKLLSRIETDFGRNLSLAFVFQAPTVELMAELLRNPDQTLRSRAIVPIQPNGSKPPLFWVRGGPRFRLLAEKLGPDQPFFGLELPFSDATKLPVPYRLEDIAAYLVRAMREVQPHGPYLLAGLCVNAVIAYEIARQVTEQGERVQLLAMLDGHNHAYYKNPLRDGRYTGRLKYHLYNLLRSDIREGSTYLLDRIDEARRKVERVIWQLSSTRQANGNNDRPHNTDFVVHPAFHRYEPKPYLGKVTLLQSSDWPDGPYFDFKLGWQDLAEGGVEFHRIPGDHPSMFTEPNVNLVGAILKMALQNNPSLDFATSPEHNAEPEYSGERHF